jgi:hypothetical protein
VIESTCTVTLAPPEGSSIATQGGGFSALP